MDPSVSRFERASSEADHVREERERRERLVKFNACRAICLERHKKSERVRKTCVDDCARTTDHIW